MANNSKRIKRINLLEACATGNRSQILEICSNRQRRKEIELRDNHNWTPLHHVVSSGSVECLKILLKIKGINTKAKTFEGLTALHVACTKDTTPHELVLLLLKRDSDLVRLANNEDVSPLHSAIQSGRLDLVKLLIEYGAAVDYTDLDGEHALFYAVRHAHLDIIRHLLTNTKCDPFLKNCSGHTTLELAIITKIFNPMRDTAADCISELIKTMCDRKGEETDLLIQSIKLCFSILERDVLQQIFNIYYLRENNSKQTIIKKLFELKETESVYYYRIAVCMHQVVIPYCDILLFGDNFEHVKNILDIFYQFYEKDKNFFCTLYREIMPNLPKWSKLKKDLYENGFYSFLLENISDDKQLLAIKHYLKFLKLTIKQIPVDFNNLLIRYCNQKNICLENIGNFHLNIGLIILLPFSTLTGIKESNDTVPSLLDLCRVLIRECLFKKSTSLKDLCRINQLNLAEHLKNLLRFNYYNLSF